MFDLHSVLGVFSLLPRKYIIKKARIPVNRANEAARRGRTPGSSLFSLRTSNVYN